MSNRKKNLLIVGSCSEIGSAVARDLAEKNYHLILMDNDEKANRALAKGIPDAEIITADFRNRSELRALCKQISQYELDASLINVGLASHRTNGIIRRKVNDRHVEAILGNMITLNRACGRDMKGRNGGSIINTVSIKGLRDKESLEVYRALKFGLKGFLSCFHLEMKRYDVKVSGLYPNLYSEKRLSRESTKVSKDLDPFNSLWSVKDMLKGFHDTLRTGKLEVYLSKSGRF